MNPLPKPDLRILNLEDSANDAELNQAMLSARWPACSLTRVDNREDFLTALAAGNFDLILSDFTMPGFGGSEALALALQMRPEIPFLFVSGTIGEDTAIEALKSGATDYILKHRLMRLIPAVDRALREVEQAAECQRAEEAMRQSEHKYRELFESLEEAAFLTEEKSGKIIDVNRQAQTVLGRPRGEILGRPQSSFLSPAETNENTSAGTMVFDHVLHGIDGATLPVHVHATRLTLYGRPLVLRLCRAWPVK
jgi:PAS domain S-box-containing protein